MKHQESPSENYFSGILALVRQQQHFLSAMMQWKMSATLRDTVAAQMAQLTELLRVLVSDTNEVSQSKVKRLKHFNGNYETKG